MKIILVVGARPNFMKVAPIMRAITRFNAGLRDSKSNSGLNEIHPVLVHTGQHYDAQMSGAFFSDLALPEPDIFLGAGSASHAEQTAEIMKRFEPVLIKENPDMVLLVGDVNSTLACALVTSKITLSKGNPRPLVVHVEAGLRSFDRDMPEEINRMLTDHLSDLLFVTESSGTENLKREGIPSERVFLVGNTMIDSLSAYRKKAEHSDILDRLELRPAGAIIPYALLTLHRPGNVDDREGFVEILQGLQPLAASLRIIFPAHPRTRKQMEVLKLGSYLRCELSKAGGAMKETPSGGITLIDPLGYLDFVYLMKNARLVVTDSGGIQEETTFLQVPCVTVRENTERPVTLQIGTNVLAGTRREGIREAIERQLQQPRKGQLPEKWDGRSSERIVEILAGHLRMQAK